MTINVTPGMLISGGAQAYRKAALRADYKTDHPWMADGEDSYTMADGWVRRLLGDVPRIISPFSGRDTRCLIMVVNNLSTPITLKETHLEHCDFAAQTGQIPGITSGMAGMGLYAIRMPGMYGFRVCLTFEGDKKVLPMPATIGLNAVEAHWDAAFISTNKSAVELFNSLVHPSDSGKPTVARQTTKTVEMIASFQSLERAANPNDWVFHVAIVYFGPPPT